MLTPLGAFTLSFDTSAGNNKEAYIAKDTRAEDFQAIPLSMNLGRILSAGASVTLSVTNANKIKLYCADKHTLIPLAGGSITWTAPNNIPALMYVQGVDASSQLKDVKFTLTYDKGTDHFTQTVELTVVDVSFNPAQRKVVKNEPNQPTSFGITIIPSAASDKVSFTSSGTSAIVDSQEGGTDPDFTLGYTVPPTGPSGITHAIPHVNSPAGYDTVCENRGEIFVTSANHPPTALNQTLTTSINQPIRVLLRGTDPDNDELTYSIVNWAGDRLTTPNGVLTKIPDGQLPADLQGKNRSYLFTPNQNVTNVTDTFQFGVTDRPNLTPVTGTITINVITPQPVPNNNPHPPTNSKEYIGDDMYEDHVHSGYGPYGTANVIGILTYSTLDIRGAYQFINNRNQLLPEYQNPTYPLDLNIYYSVPSDPKCLPTHGIIHPDAPQMTSVDVPTLIARYANDAQKFDNYWFTSGVVDLTPSGLIMTPSGEIDDTLSYIKPNNKNGYDTLWFRVSGVVNVEGTPVRVYGWDAVTFYLTPINDKPSFDVNSSVSVGAEDSPRDGNGDPIEQTIPWAYNVCKGPKDITNLDDFSDTGDGQTETEGNQTIEFIWEKDVNLTTNPDLLESFSIDVVANPGDPHLQNGSIHLKKKRNAYGKIVYNVQLKDNGGSGYCRGWEPFNEGDTSNTVQVTINVDPVNDDPTFTDGSSTITVPEDDMTYGQRGLYSAVWATNLWKGELGDSLEERDQTYGTPNISYGGDGSDRNYLFADPPHFDIDPDTHQATLVFQTNPDANGYVYLTVSFTDNLGGESRSKSFYIIVSPVNDPPTYTPGPLTINADVDKPFLMPWATNLWEGNPGDTSPSEINQNLTASITYDYGFDLFAILPAFAIDENLHAAALSFRPKPGVTGAARIRVKIFDGLAYSTESVIDINIALINDPPTYTPGQSTITVAEDSGAYEQIWATNLWEGDFQEVSEIPQSLFAIVTRIAGDELFEELPTVVIDENAHTATLRFKPKPNAWGTGDNSAKISIAFSDDGTPALTSLITPVTIEITPVNDKPHLSGDVTITREEKQVTCTDLDTGMTAWQGELDDTYEGEQSLILTPNVTSGGNLFDVLPTVTWDAQMKKIKIFFTQKLYAFGRATVDVTATDDQDPALTSDPKTITIDITPINDTPTYTLKTITLDTPLEEDCQPQTQTWIWAENVWPGAKDDQFENAAQSLTATVNPKEGGDLEFVSTPTVTINADHTATLNFTPKHNSFGRAIVDIVLTDNGDPALSATTASVTIDVSPVNDAPTFTSGPTTIDHRMAIDPADGILKPMPLVEDSGENNEIWATDLWTSEKDDLRETNQTLIPNHCCPR